MASLAYRIRCIVQDAERFLAQPEIYAALGGGRPNSNVFCVTVAQMLKARQLRRRKAARDVHTATGARFVYGPGPVVVSEGRACAARRPKMVGFMELKRMREAKARARRRASA